MSTNPQESTEHLQRNQIEPILDRPPSQYTRRALLLGGVQDFDVDEIVGSEEEWRNRVVALAKTQLAKAGGQLRTPYLDLASRKTERTTGRM